LRGRALRQGPDPDDIDFNRDLIRLFYDTCGFDLLDASNGREALDLARKFSPDLILLDMRMPVMDGYRASALLKQDPQLRHIPVVAVTASVMEDDMARLGGNCEGYLLKPLGRADLIRCTMRFLPHWVAGAEPRQPAARSGGSAAALAPELVLAMLRAADLADMAELHRLLEEARLADPGFADALGRHLERFDYEAVRDALGRPG
jgi:CheY-like chemotaxis protein